MVVDTERKRPYRVFRELKAELVRRGVTQVELARRVKVSPQHLNSVLNGYDPMTGRLAREIAFAIAVPLSFILPEPVGQEAAR